MTTMAMATTVGIAIIIIITFGTAITITGHFTPIVMIIVTITTMAIMVTAITAIMDTTIIGITITGKLRLESQRKRRCGVA
jgi:hypothetical protein